MSKFFFIGMASSVILIFSGCVQQRVNTSPSVHLGNRQVLEKNYKIGHKITSYVGKAIIKNKRYMVDLFSSKYMHASDDFVISGGIVTMSGSKNTDYRIRGETKLDEKIFTVLTLSQSAGKIGIEALINSDGSVYHRMLNKGVPMNYTFKTSPLDLRFIPSKKEEVVNDSGYLSYDLLYGGTDGESINITYREYTVGELARPAFYQNVVYEVGKKQIRFRDIILNVHEATNEKIVFTVISDGLPD